MDVQSSGVCNNQFGVNTDQSCLVIYFDVNGDRKPNVVGKDIYAVIQTENGLTPACNNLSENEIEKDCSTKRGYCCLKKVIKNNWEIDNKIWNK